MNTAELDPFALDHLENPYDLYRRLRDTAPIHQIRDIPDVQAELRGDRARSRTSSKKWYGSKARSAVTSGSPPVHVLVDPSYVVNGR